MKENDLDLSGVRTLFVAPCLGRFGGIEAFCHALAEEILRCGAKVTILRKRVSGFSANGSIESQEQELREKLGVELADRLVTEFVSARSPRLLAEVWKADLVHVHNPLVEIIVTAKILRKPCVTTIYNWRRRNLHWRTLGWAAGARLADRRWYISEFVWDSWEQHRRTGSARLPVVSRMPAGRISPNRRKGFLFLGRWIPNKGLRTLLEAYRTVAPDGTRWPLILVGDGPLREEIERRVKEENIDGVQFTGFVSDEERNRLIRNAKWMVTPPNTNEDLGLTPLEARAVGVPCIVSKDGGLKETGGPHALRCRPGCSESLAQAMREAIGMSEDCYARLSELSKEGLADYVRPLDDYAIAYRELLRK